MDTTRNAGSITHPSLWEEALHWPVHQWKNKLQNLSAEEIQSILPAASLQYDSSHWKEKILSAINGLADLNQLEAAGKALDLLQFLTILSAATQGDYVILQKLNPLFVGMSPQLFRELLQRASAAQMNMVKHEAITEAVQHHLSILSAELKTDVNVFSSSIESKVQEIERLSIDELGIHEVEALFKGIQTLYEQGSFLLKEINNALSIAWNTPRADIIEHLSHTKELLQRILAESFGASSPASPTTGIYALLQKKLNNIYADIAFDQDVENIDDLPALEAIVKFSIWYLKDYWEIGLLPEIRSIHDLELSADVHSDPELRAYREKLLANAEHNLEKLGLKTLKDVKQAHIYSKKGLKEYISSHLT